MVGVFGVGAAKDEAGHEFIEDDPVRDAWSMASQRVIVLNRGQKRFELAPEGADD